jgi:hypothetical protein
MISDSLLTALTANLQRKKPKSRRRMITESGTPRSQRMMGMRRFLC